MPRSPHFSTALTRLVLALLVALWAVPAVAAAQARPPVRIHPIVHPRPTLPRPAPIRPHRAPRPPATPQAKGRLSCRILENGAAASGTVVVRQGTREVATGSCGTPLALAPGSYTAVLRLDGALDQPEQERPVTVRSGQASHVQADFSTGILEVMITAGGRRAAGLATILRGGTRVGTLGSGVPAHLSAGTYTVVVRYRTTERRFDAVTLGRGQRRALQARF